MEIICERYHFIARSLGYYLGNAFGLRSTRKLCSDVGERHGLVPATYLDIEQALCCVNTLNLCSSFVVLFHSAPLYMKYKRKILLVFAVNSASNFTRPL
jgi:hypothetical protein